MAIFRQLGSGKNIDAPGLRTAQHFFVLSFIGLSAPLLLTALPNRSTHDNARAPAMSVHQLSMPQLQLAADRGGTSKEVLTAALGEVAATAITAENVSMMDLLWEANKPGYVAHPTLALGIALLDCVCCVAMTICIA